MLRRHRVERGGFAARRVRGDRAGFSLTEVMVVVVIMAIAFIGSMQLLTFAHQHNDLGQERARAHQVVCEEIEWIRHELFSRVTGGRTVTVWDNGTPDDASDDTLGTLEVVMRDPDGVELSAAPVPAVRMEVEVTLTWSPRGRLGEKTYRETVMTYIVP